MAARGGAGGTRERAMSPEGKADYGSGAEGSGAEGGPEPEFSNLKVKVNVAGKVFVVPCGKGQQSVKWLATVVAQRYQMMTKNAGRQRQREAQLDPPGFFLPSSITVRGKGDVTFPATRVCDVFASSEGKEITEVDVELSREYELDEDGSKKQSTWAAMAFNFSDAGRHRAELKRKADLVKEEEAKKAAGEEAARKEQEELDQMAKLLATDLENPAALEDALQRDWTHVRVERVTEDLDEIAQIKKLLLKNFVAISDIFRVYSAFHPGSSAVAMCKQEFNHVILVCQIGHLQKDRAALERVFVEANGARNDDPMDNTRFLTRFEFMEALLLLARFRYPTLSAPKSVEKLLDVHILPRAAKMAMGTVRKTLASPEMLKYVTDYRKQLRAAFDHYKALDSDVSVPESNFSISFDEFIVLLKDANLIDEERKAEGRDLPPSKRNDLTNQEIQELFAAVQRDSEEPDPHAKVDTSGQKMEELVYGEFLEAIARTGMETWEDHRLPLEVRMKMGFAAVCALVGPDMKVHKLAEDVGLPEPEDFFDFRTHEQKDGGVGKTPFITESADGHMTGVV